MYNIFHSASTRGPADAFRPRQGLLGARARRRRRLARIEAARGVERGRRSSLAEAPIDLAPETAEIASLGTDEGSGCPRPGGRAE